MYVNKTKHFEIILTWIKFWEKRETKREKDRKRFHARVSKETYHTCLAANAWAQKSNLFFFLLRVWPNFGGHGHQTARNNRRTSSFIHLHVDKTNFHMKDFALGLALKQSRKATRKSLIKGYLLPQTTMNTWCYRVYRFQMCFQWRWKLIYSKVDAISFVTIFVKFVDIYISCGKTLAVKAPDFRFTRCVHWFPRGFLWSNRNHCLVFTDLNRFFSCLFVFCFYFL